MREPTAMFAAFASMKVPKVDQGGPLGLRIFKTLEKNHSERQRPKRDKRVPLQGGMPKLPE